jgi:hypothetical protein
LPCAVELGYRLLGLLVVGHLDQDLVRNRDHACPGDCSLGDILWLLMLPTMIFVGVAILSSRARESLTTRSASSLASFTENGEWFLLRVHDAGCSSHVCKSGPRMASESELRILLPTSSLPKLTTGVSMKLSRTFPKILIRTLALRITIEPARVK